MRKDVTVATEARETRGKNEARRLRARGMAPAVVYGVGKDAVAIAVSPKEINKLLYSASGFNTIFNLDLQSEGSVPVKVVEVQVDPIKSRMLHVDLQRIDLSKPITVKVPVHVTGEAKGVKQQGGLLEIVHRDVEIVCLPDDIPEAFTLDVSEMAVNDTIRAKDLETKGSIKLKGDAEAVLVHVVSLKAEEGEAEGGAAAAEPEVIKKGKKEEAGDAKAPAKAPAKKK